MGWDIHKRSSIIGILIIISGFVLAFIDNVQTEQTLIGLGIIILGFILLVIATKVESG